MREQTGLTKKGTEGLTKKGTDRHMFLDVGLSTVTVKQNIHFTTVYISVLKAALSNYNT